MVSWKNKGSNSIFEYQAAIYYGYLILFGTITRISSCKFPVYCKNMDKSCDESSRFGHFFGRCSSSLIALYGHVLFCCVFYALWVHPLPLMSPQHVPSLKFSPPVYLNPSSNLSVFFFLYLILISSWSFLNFTTELTTSPAPPPFADLVPSPYLFITILGHTGYEVSQTKCHVLGSMWKQKHPARILVNCSSTPVGHLMMM